MSERLDLIGFTHFPRTLPFHLLLLRCLYKHTKCQRLLSALWYQLKHHEGQNKMCSNGHEEVKESFHFHLARYLSGYSNMNHIVVC